jgi:SAM-dependent methyltransferase
VQHVCPIVGRLTESDPTPFARGRWRLVACRETGFVYLPDPPAYDALAEDHAWESTSAAERARRRHEEPVLARLSEGFKHVRRRLFRTRCPFATIARGRLEATRFDGPVRVVDVGCADAGFTLGVARRLEAAGFPLEVIGIEVSRALAARARERLADIGGTALEASALDGLRGLEAGSATVVLMSSFLEHEARPLELLREVRRVLRPGGFAIVKVPNFACWNRAWPVVRLPLSGSCQLLHAPHAATARRQRRPRLSAEPARSGAAERQHVRGARPSGRAAGGRLSGCDTDRAPPVSPVAARRAQPA